MAGLSITLGIMIFLVLILISSRYFYCVETKTAVMRISRSSGLNVLDLEYSFEQIVYFVSLPSNLPNIKNARQEDVFIKKDYRSLFFPRLVGIKIYVKTSDQDVIISYLPIKDFRLPMLDRMLEQGQINESDYLKIGIYKLDHHQTQAEICEEAYRQIRLGRSGTKELRNKMNSLKKGS